MTGTDYPFDLGPWVRTITTKSAQAQVWFDRGLNWTYAYNHEEAVTCYRRALEHDQGCAMAHWGIAYCNGPFYNRPWIRYSDAEIEDVLPVCHAHAQQALAHIGGCTPAEQALIRAIPLRYRKPESLDRDELNRWHGEFAGAMRAAWTAHQDDPDIAALYVEAAVTRTPRQLWDLQKGIPKDTSDIVDAMDVCTRAMARCRAAGIIHPGLLHMHIHALEMSPFPERALMSADLLKEFAPDAGHMEHMPAHVYVLVGDYAQAVAQSLRSVRADDKYRDVAGARNFYTTARAHDLHLLMYSAMFLGQHDTAMWAADRIVDEATDELIEWSPPFMSAILDGYAAMRIHVMVRFGKWREITQLPPVDDPELRPISAAMLAYGKAVAHAALREFAEAEEARAAFHRIAAAIDPEAIFLSNPIVTMLAVGEAMMEGEIAYHRGEHDRAFDWLRLAVARDDALNYTEPWAWMHPPRHALGALLAEQGRFDEAERAYREDLGLAEGVPRCCQHPDNVWALHGLLECVERRGPSGEAKLLRQRLDMALERADQKITASCCCRGMGQVAG